MLGNNWKLQRGKRVIKKYYKKTPHLAHNEWKHLFMNSVGLFSFILLQFRRKLRQADRQLQTFSFLCSFQFNNQPVTAAGSAKACPFNWNVPTPAETSASEGPEARYKRSSEVILTVRPKQSHLTFNKHGAGKSSNYKRPHSKDRQKLPKQSLITYLLPDHRSKTASLRLLQESED